MYQRSAIITGVPPASACLAPTNSWQILKSPQLIPNCLVYFRRTINPVVFKIIATPLLVSMHRPSVSLLSGPRYSEKGNTPSLVLVCLFPVLRVFLPAVDDVTKVTIGASVKRRRHRTRNDLLSRWCQNLVRIGRVKESGPISGFKCVSSDC